MDMWTAIAKSSNTELKRLKMFFELVAGFTFKYNHFYKIDSDYRIQLDSEASMGEIGGISSSVIKMPENEMMDRQSKIEQAMRQFERDQRLAKNLLNIMNYVLDEKERKVALSYYFNIKGIDLDVKKRQYFNILNKVNDKMIVAWGFFYCDENGIIISIDKIYDRYLLRQEMLKNVPRNPKLNKILKKL